MSGSELSLSLLSYNVTTRADSVRLLVWDGCARVYVKQNTRRTRKRYKTSPWTCGAGVTVVSEQGRRRWTTSEDVETRCSRWDQPRRKADASKDGAPSKQNVAQQWRRKTREKCSGRTLMQECSVVRHCRSVVRRYRSVVDHADLWWKEQPPPCKMRRHLSPIQRTSTAAEGKTWSRCRCRWRWQRRNGKGKTQQFEYELQKFWRNDEGPTSGWTGTHSEGSFIAAEDGCRASVVSAAYAQPPARKTDV